MTAPAWLCLGHRTRGELAPICRDCERRHNDPKRAIPSVAAIVVVDGAATVICAHWHASPEPIPSGEAQDSDFAEFEKYGGTD
jgi:hypothetical protein